MTTAHCRSLPSNTFNCCFSHKSVSLHMFTMKVLLLTILALLCSALTVNSLKCYKCTSSTSMEDCSSNQVAQACIGTPSNASCATAEVMYESGGVSVRAYSKGCTSLEICSMDRDRLCSEEGMQCNIECCSDDLCNSKDSGEEGSAVEFEGMSCYECMSTTSMDDCIRQQKETQCKSGWTKCGILEHHSPQMTGFRKGCVTEEICQTFCASSAEAIEQCELHCCDGKLCNAAIPSIGA